MADKQNNSLPFDGGVGERTTWGPYTSSHFLIVWLEFTWIHLFQIQSCAVLEGTRGEHSLYLAWKSTFCTIRPGNGIRVTRAIISYRTCSWSESTHAQRGTHLHKFYKQRELLQESTRAALIPFSGIQESKGKQGVELQQRDQVSFGRVPGTSGPLGPLCLISSPAASAWACPISTDNIYPVCCTPEPPPQSILICFPFSPASHLNICNRRLI